MLTLTNLIDNGKCYEMVRQFRWPDGVCCPGCDSKEITKRGKDEVQSDRQRYACKGCGKQFDDLTDSIFAGRHQPLRVWVGCLYLMGLNLSNQQIAQELDLHKDDVHQMTRELRQAIVKRKPEVQLSGEVEFDEVYVTAGHKGNPEAVQKKGVKVAAGNSKGFGVVGLSKPKSPRSLG
jgi:transposase-like protein